MKFSAIKDYKKRVFYKKYEVDKNILKVFNLEKPQDVGLKTDNMSRYFAKGRIKNRCSLTSRAKANLSFFKLSRMIFKNKASFGFLEGIRKSSW
jgi:small subunit ribosomal protein S14